MKLIPAIDLKNNVCVRLTKGKENTSRVFNKDPIKQAKFFEKQGCKRIHIVDLDAAFGNNETNKKTILKIREAVSTEIELGGGIRSKKTLEFWIDKKINFLIIGSYALKNKNRTKALTELYKNKIYIALDDLYGKFMINGWLKDSNKKTEDIINFYNRTNIKGYVYTDIERDGTLSGINIDKISNFLSYSNKPIIIGGGLTDYKDLKNLFAMKNSKIEGIIAGKSFYLGKINLKTGQKLISKNA